MAHVMAGGRGGGYPATADLRVRRIVTEYRRRLGETPIVRELGGYAWHGDARQPDRAWAETWAEAFRLYDADPGRLTPPTRSMVREVLRALGYPQD